MKDEPLVALLSDFGTRDWYVATLKAVMTSRCPRARFIDITHDIPPQDIIAGAFTLAAAVPWFPPQTVFLAIVDPGVGSERAILAACADRHFFVGPDNGLLTLSFQRAHRVRIIRLTNPRYWLSPVSRTFQGRDIMAPVAAALARTRTLASLGTPVKHIAPLQLPMVRQTQRTLHGHVVHIDAFGNLITNLPASVLSSAQSAGRVTVRYKQRTARVVSSYAAGRAGELVALAGSLGLVELATPNGSAAWTFNGARGEEVALIR